MPLPYKPAADSRHRRACFALYRALVRQGLQIPLPNDILENTKNNPIPKRLAPRSSSYLVGRKDGNPIPTLITNAFRRNRKLESPRLICLALKNGYRFLDLFVRAKAQAPPPVFLKDNLRVMRSLFPPVTATALQPKPAAAANPSRPIYDSIVKFLYENQARVNHYLLNREANKKPNPYLPHRDHTPLLTLLPPSEEDEQGAGPVYVPTTRPLPLSKLSSSGVRKLPNLDSCMGYPFLRLSKPQSPVLSVMVWSNARHRQARLERLNEMREVDLDMGRQEDQWDWLVERMESVVERAQNGEEIFGQVEFGEEEDDEDEEDREKEGDVAMDWAEFSENIERDLTEIGEKKTTTTKKNKKKKNKKGNDKMEEEKEEEEEGLEEGQDQEKTTQQLDGGNGGGGGDGVEGQGESADWLNIASSGLKMHPQRQAHWANTSEISYHDSWRLSIEETTAKLNKQQEHWIARGKALWEIVLAERELAEKEARERGRKVHKPVNPRYLDKVKDWRRCWGRRQLKVREDKIRAAEEKGDLEEAERLREMKFKVQAPRRRGFSKKEMLNST